MSVENEPTFPPALTNRGYTMAEEIGSGMFSKVFKCKKNTNPDKTYACKRIDINAVPIQWKDNCLRMELKVLKKVEHPNIVRIENIIKTRNAVFIFMDYAEKGSIYKRLQNQKKPFPESVAKVWFSQILSALSFCHMKGVAHRDIKLDNFLLNSDYCALLSDFGFACITYDKSGEIMRNTSCGHPAYMAPEVELTTKIWPYDAKAADMYSMGVCLYEMLNFDKPFPEYLSVNNPIAFVTKQRNKDFKFHAPIDKVLSKEIKDLVNQLLEPKPGLRLTADLALIHNGILPH